jgi:hypothetical protein
MVANMERGTSATGVAYQDAAHIHVKKAEGPADKFVESLGDDLVTIAQSPRGLIHARATTKGSEKQNENNHPVVGFNWAVVHNGMVHNDDDVWAHYKASDNLERFADVDTSVIPLVLGRGATIEESIRNLSILGGSLTIAAWSSLDIERIVLARFGHNDLYMFHDASAEIMYWSSASSAAFLMTGPTFGGHKFLSYSKLADSHVLVLQPGGFKTTRAFKVERKPFLVPRPKVEHITGHTYGISTAIERSALEAQATQKIPVQPAVMSPHRIIVPLDAFEGQRSFIVQWNVMEVLASKPLPMHEYFSRTWHSLMRDDAEARSRSTDLVKFTGYGRWIWECSPEASFSPRTFKPYKRTREWWAKAYRTNFKFPLARDIAGETELDDQCAWEHYDLNTQLLDGTSRRFLGFMCPFCGVWTSSVALQIGKERCEYCNVKSRIYPQRTA